MSAKTATWAVRLAARSVEKSLGKKKMAWTSRFFISRSAWAIVGHLYSTEISGVASILWMNRRLSSQRAWSTTATGRLVTFSFSYMKQKMTG